MPGYKKKAEKESRAASRKIKRDKRLSFCMIFVHLCRQPSLRHIVKLLKRERYSVILTPPNVPPRDVLIIKSRYCYWKCNFPMTWSGSRSVGW